MLIDQVSTGIEWVVDARGADPARLADASMLKSLFDEIVADLQLNAVGDDRWHVFPGTGGITGLRLLSESHLTVHTFPEHGSLCLNLFCCRPRAAWDFDSRLRALTGAHEVSVRRFERHYGSDTPSYVSLDSPGMRPAIA